MTASAHSINRLLPQTQCRECGYAGCLPYAEALAQGTAEVNLCAPGGETVMRDIAALLGRPPRPPVRLQEKALALIDEAACIGCTACIRACPVDAIMGASKQMHTVISQECTGCGLCVAPCPVDCISMQPVEADCLPLARSGASEARFAASAHALNRYQWREARKERDAQERRRKLAEREAAAKAAAAETGTAAAPAFNPADLIAKAMARATAQQTQRAQSANREAYRARQLEEAKERAAFRRAQRDVQYGTETEKAAALAYLREYKAAQEAKAAK